MLRIRLGSFGACFNFTQTLNDTTSWSKRLSLCARGWLTATASSDNYGLSVKSATSLPQSFFNSGTA